MTRQCCLCLTVTLRCAARPPLSPPFLAITVGRPFSPPFLGPLSLPVASVYLDQPSITCVCERVCVCVCVCVCVLCRPIWVYHFYLGQPSNTPRLSVSITSRLARPRRDRPLRASARATHGWLLPWILPWMTAPSPLSTFHDIISLTQTRRFRELIRVK